MNDDRARAVEQLLVETEAAHAVYEKSELSGVYDEQWPAWYAHYAVDHGLGETLGEPVEAGDVAAYFSRAWDEYRALDPKPAEGWSTWTSKRIATELRGRPDGGF